MATETSTPAPSHGYSRRDFIRRTAIGAAALAAPLGKMSSFAGARGSPTIAVFSKVFQELKLDFIDAAEITSEAGLDGIDCPLRAGGEIQPEKVEDEFPRYIEALRKRKMRMELLTTGITSVSSPKAEAILRLAKKFGIGHYRIGFLNRSSSTPVDKQIREIKAQLGDLAALNKEIGITGMIQNHSYSGSPGYLCGDLGEMVQTVSDFAPEQIGVAFDIGHALVMHGDNWRGYFDQLKSHFKIAYVKDVTRTGRWVALGQGDIGGTGYFTLLKQMRYHAPISLHIEYDWSNHSEKTKAGLVTAIRQDLAVLKQWLA